MHRCGTPQLARFLACAAQTSTQLLAAGTPQPRARIRRSRSSYRILARAAGPTRAALAAGVCVLAASEPTNDVAAAAPASSAASTPTASAVSADAPKPARLGAVNDGSDGSDGSDDAAAAAASAAAAAALVSSVWRAASAAAAARAARPAGSRERGWDGRGSRACNSPGSRKLLATRKDSPAGHMRAGRQNRGRRHRCDRGRACGSGGSGRRLASRRRLELGLGLGGGPLRRLGHRQLDALQALQRQALFHAPGHPSSDRPLGSDASRPPAAPLLAVRSCALRTVGPIRFHARLRSTAEYATWITEGLQQGDQCTVCMGGRLGMPERPTREPLAPASRGHG